MNMPKKMIFIIIAVVLLIILSMAGYFYWINSKKSETKNVLENISNVAEDITDSATKGVVPSLQNNPLQDNPDINPASNANPIKDIKTNPF
jgi:flagellar basal body-associated protein FliL